jgi:hypothetical protein
MNYNYTEGFLSPEAFGVFSDSRIIVPGAPVARRTVPDKKRDISTIAILTMHFIYFSEINPCNCGR